MDKENLQLLLLFVFGICGFFLFVFLIAFVELDKLLLLHDIAHAISPSSIILSSTKATSKVDQDEELGMHVTMEQPLETITTLDMEEEEPSSSTIPIENIPLPILQASTSHFSKSNLLHEGNFAHTFFGSLGDKLVAIKRFKPLSATSSPFDDPFLNELQFYTSLSMQLHASSSTLRSSSHCHQPNVEDPTILPSSTITSFCHSILPSSSRTPCQNSSLNHPKLLDLTLTINQPIIIPLSLDDPIFTQLDHSSTVPLARIKTLYSPRFDHSSHLSTQPSTLQEHHCHHYLSHNVTLDCPSFLPSQESLLNCHFHHNNVEPPILSRPPFLLFGQCEHLLSFSLHFSHLERHRHHSYPTSPASSYNTSHKYQRQYTSLSSSYSTETSSTSYYNVPHPRHTSNYYSYHKKSSLPLHQCALYPQHKKNHSYFVPLLGYCLEKQERLLVYEYAPCRDLATTLTLSSSIWKAKCDNTTTITLPKDIAYSLCGPIIMSWITRLKIATQVAEGIAVLHYACQPPIAHRDLKASNVLLTSTFDARLGGLKGAHPMEEGEFPFCDIYSYGKILVQLILGIEAKEEYFMDAFKSHADIQTLVQVIDPSMMINEDLVKEVLGVAMLAKACLDERTVKDMSMFKILYFLKDPTKPLAKLFQEHSDC